MSTSLARLPLIVVLSLPLVAAELPELTQPVTPAPLPLTVEAGQRTTVKVKIPAAGGLVPVLACRARCDMPGAAGCNFVLRLAIDGRPLAESRVRPRLLNKPPNLDPPNTQFHFTWYSSVHQAWMTMFADRFDRNWGGSGQDCEYVLDLTGLVIPGREHELTIEHAMPTLPAAVKRERAPLYLDALSIGLMDPAEVTRLRAAALAGRKLRACPVAAAVPAGETAGPRPYEVVWSGVKAPPAQVGFDDLSGWRLSAVGDAELRLDASVARPLWRERNARFTYEGGQEDTRALLEPAEPIEIKGRFDAVNLWMYGALKRQADRPLQLTVLLADAGGMDYEVDLGPVMATYWSLQHGVLNSAALATATWPMRLVGLEIANCKVEGKREIWLDSLHFYQQNRRPEKTFRRPAKPVFPVGDGGLRPPAPKGVKVAVARQGSGARLVSTAADGAVEFVIDPSAGCLDGITARVADATFRPLAGGAVTFESDGGAVKLTESKVVGDRLTASWADASGRRWSAEYRVSGRTLAIDLRCAGGQATGVECGAVEGLPDARGVLVPYLLFGRQRPGGRIACGGGVFVSVIPDVYHSDFSAVDTAVEPDREGRLELLAGTVYNRLSDGRRNGLRERLLVTVSPVFDQVLPSIPNPPSPNRAALAPYLFLMGSEAPGLYRTMKDYGIDHVIANDFAKFFVQDFAEGFAGRWRPVEPMTIAQIQAYRRELKQLGYKFGMYQDTREFFPLNEWWDENKVCLTGDGDLLDAWYGNFHTKPAHMSELMRNCGQKVAKLFGPECVYLDVHTNLGPYAVDYEAGVELAGMGRGTILGNGDACVEARQWYGSTISEGIFRWLYAGLTDMDYAQITVTADKANLPFLPDFDLLRIHPLQIGTLMGYGPTNYLTDEELKDLNTGSGAAAPAAFYKLVSASLAYGHAVMLGYGYIPPLQRTIQYYALMQAPQREYLTDTVVDIAYHDGSRFLTTSEALRRNVTEQRRLRVRYARGLTLYVNHHGSEPWTVRHGGQEWRLPPYGWLIDKPGELLAYSAELDGVRVDFVQCLDYVYLNSAAGPRRAGPLEVHGAAWLKRDGAGWRLIPCGHVGSWKITRTPEWSRLNIDYELGAPTADRGCPHLAVRPSALPDGPTKVQALDPQGQPVATETTEADGWLRLKATAGVKEYRLSR